MKIPLVLYRILSFLLLPVAALLGLVTLMALVISLGNFSMLFPSFIIGSCVIYIFCSFTFLQKGIERQQLLKSSLLDWIKVNGYVAIFFSAMGLIQGTVLLLSPAVMNKAMEAFFSSQNVTITEKEKLMMVKMIHGMLYFMVALSAVLLVHIRLSFKGLKQYNYLFAA